MTVLAALCGYLIGSLPTAAGLGLAWGVDLRGEGSGNPGANNARRLGGMGLASIVLLVEIGKGVLAVWVGALIADEAGAVAAGIGAIAGNVYNVWYRFGGGKGLGITAGVLMAAWPIGFVIALAILISVVIVTKSSGIAALSGAAGLVALALVGLDSAEGAWWGVSQSAWAWLAAGILVVLTPKHLHDARVKLSGHRRSRESV